MELAHAVLLGVIQGVTEFLPISSDGHLTLFQAARGGSETDLALDVALHIGTLGSILVFFRKDLVQLAKGILGPPASEQGQERKRLGLIALATIPTGIIGLALKDSVQQGVSSFRAAGIGFLITALLLAGGEWAIRRGGKDLTRVPWWNALVIGVVQGAAVWPGLSRSGGTIAAALLLGWKWEEAGRFSFLAAIPAVAGAVLLMAADMGSLDPFVLLIGIAVAFAVGYASLALLIRFLAARCLWPFSVYCFLAAIFALTR